MKRRTTTILLSIMLSALLIAGVTFAYFTALTEPVTNTFTASGGISISLAEPTWDNSTHPDDQASEIEEEDLGRTLAQNFVPGRLIPKDPNVKNTSEEPVWVAIKLEYTGEAGSFAAIDAFADIDFDGANWEAKDASNTVFYYRNVLGAGQTTSDLFTKVLIDAGVSAEDIEGFNIVITAYAVQAEGLNYGQAKAELDGLM